MARPGFRLNAFQLALLAYSVTILVGAGLLALPFSQLGAPHDWVDHLFMAASAVCTTGLATLDPRSSYTPFGHGVLMLLMQLGGLGYMTVFTVSMVIIGKRMALRDRLNLQEALDQPGMAGIVDFVKSIALFSLATEAVGFGLLSMSTVSEFGWGEGLFIALFHTVSAFNNSGFSTFTEGMIRWQHDPYVLLVVSGLIVVGGLGFNVNRELFNRHVLKKPPNVRWNLLIGVVLGWTAALLAIGTLLIWVSEVANPKTLGSLPLHLQAANAFFMAVQPRSAGFASVDVAAMTEPSLLVTLLLMFVGGGPGSTAGGIKVTTVAVVAAAMLASLRGQDEINLFHLKARLGLKLVLKALTVVVGSIGVIVLVTGYLTTIEPHPFLSILFEVVSAFGSVGTTLGITTLLTPVAKLVLVATMLVGRVGVLAVMLAFLPAKNRPAVRYPEETLLVG